jgi:hypothetical protein
MRSLLGMGSTIHPIMVLMLLERSTLTTCFFEGRSLPLARRRP